MRNLASHWTIAGAARELNRRADLWELTEDQSGRLRERLDSERVLHENTCMVLSLARYKLMIRGEQLIAMRRFKILVMRRIDPSNGNTVDADWGNLVELVEAVYGQDIEFAFYRIGEDRDGNQTHQVIVYYDEAWEPTLLVDSPASDGATVFTEHEEFKSRRGGTK